MSDDGALSGSAAGTPGISRTRTCTPPATTRVSKTGCGAVAGPCTALKLVARRIEDTFVCRAVVGSAGFPLDLGVVGFAEPLDDTVALVVRSGSALSPATRELARMAREMLLGVG